MTMAKTISGLCGVKLEPVAFHTVPETYSSPRMTIVELTCEECGRGWVLELGDDGLEVMYTTEEEHGAN